MLGRMLEASLRRFVELQTGGSVAGSEPLGNGASRRSWLVRVTRDGVGEALVLRCDGEAGSPYGSELDLAREAVVYRALQGRAVRIPRLRGAAPGALLVERAAGSTDFTSVADATRRAEIARDLFSALAELHAQNTDRLTLPGFAVPADGPDHARCDLDRWRRIAAARLEPDALCDFAAQWLDSAAPAAERTALCHGDAGPGNFAFDGARVTALLDWEFAHLGDPLDDLAWVAVRAHLVGGIGDLADGFRTWREASGQRFEASRVDYYRALVLLRLTIACRLVLAHARGRDPAAAAACEALLPWLRCLLPEALAHAGCKATELEALLDTGRDALERAPRTAERARPLEPLPVL
jgi:aminoglycoside phosphotransferase (APT) family kinase protein